MLQVIRPIVLGKGTVTAHENWLKNFAVALPTVGKTKTKEMIINLLLLLLLLF